MTKNRILKKGFMITSGPYAGWHAYGPYIKKRKDGSPTREYYSLRKDDKRKEVLSETLGLIERAPETKDTKPFLDFL